MTVKKLLVAFAAAAVAFTATLARADQWPTKPVKILFGFPAASATDVIARTVGQKLSQKWGQSVIIDNRPGAGGNLGSALAAKAPADGYTIFFGTVANAISTTLYSKLDYDYLKDFTPITLVATTPLVLVANPALPVKNVKELIEYAKANPGKLNFGAAPGTPPHLMGELFRTLAGIDIVFVPYKGAAPALTDLLAGRTQMTMLSTAVIVPPILAGRLRALAVTSTTRWHELPDVPTMTEVGFAGFPQGSWTAVVAPAATPADVVAKLNTTINDGLRSSALHDSFVKLGAEVKVETPQQLGALLVAETRKWAEVIKSAGVAIN
jgi:tripartite-type tricarboxylate transporter receptor subunit TctC